MKKNKIIIPIVALGMLLTGCDDSKMEWGSPEGQLPITTEEIPLAVKEAIANYDDIKTYASQYTPNLIVGLGFGANEYINDVAYASGATYRGLTNANFQMVTPGNAMKHDAIVANSGALNFATVDNMLEAMAECPDMKLYGHNFLWHTQQRQAYLKSLIAPTLVVESDSNIDPIIGGDAMDFNGGTTGGWGSWGGNMKSAEVVTGAGEDGSPCLVLTNNGDGNAWEAQCAYTFDTPLDPTVEYTIRFKAKSTVGAGALQFQYQNGTTYGSQGGYNTFTVGTSWTTFEYSFTPSYEDVDRIIFNFGAVGGTYYIDDIEFGTMVADPMDNVLVGDASDFEGGTTGGWGSWGGNKADAAVVAEAAHSGELGLMLQAAADGNMWEAQNAYTFDTPLDPNSKYIIQFYAKSSNAAGTLQFQYQNGTTYGSQGGYNDFPVGTDWILCEYEFTPAYDDVDRIIINFGKVGATYYIDDIKFGKAKNQTSAARGAVIKKVKPAGPRKAKMYYVLKPAAEKREALLGAMETWISGMSAHLKEKGVTPYGYDVINEAIADGSNKVRGLNGVFGGSWNDDSGVTYYDSMPTETEADGLNLNWGNGHFYWGHFIGEDFAVKAFQMARKYLPAETKLFYNDYNLETSPAKRKAVIDFVKSIDAANGTPIVDGIGTQCHLTLNVAADESFDEQIEAFMALVEASLTELASTGKLVRITELDISLGTSNPARNQLQAQYEAYRRVFEAYKRIVPESQQSGITIWTLTDHADEHQYWLPDESPNLFDANGQRKWAYKGVCDGLAGEDLGLKYNGDDYKAWFEKNNTGNF